MLYLVFIYCSPNVNNTIEVKHGIVEFNSIEGIVPFKTTKSDLINSLGSPAGSKDSGDLRFYYYDAIGIRAVLNKNSNLIIQVDAYDSTWNYYGNSSFKLYPYEGTNGLKIGSRLYTTTDLQTILDSADTYGGSEYILNGNKLGIYNNVYNKSQNAFLKMNFYFKTNNLAFDVLDKTIVRVSIFKDYCYN
jgi:hypothetical protein